MNAPLDIRALDNIGLSTPMAARQPRTEDGRAAHDKTLAPIWQVADSAADLDAPPVWTTSDDAKAARAALETEEFQKLCASYRAPLTVERFLSNITFSLTDGRTLQLSSDPYVYLPEIWSTQ